MKEYNRARVYLDENYRSQEHFTVSTRCPGRGCRRSPAVLPGLPGGPRPRRLVGKWARRRQGASAAPTQSVRHLGGGQSRRVAWGQVCGEVGGRAGGSVWADTRGSEPSPGLLPTPPGPRDGLQGAATGSRTGLSMELGESCPSSAESLVSRGQRTPGKAALEVQQPWEPRRGGRGWQV